MGDAATNEGRPCLVQVRSLGKSYRTAHGSVELFRDLSLDVPTGELLAIVGESGAGKSTLLHILAALDTPTAGRVTIDGVDVTSLGAAGQATFRNRTVGYVWQFHYLLPEFTALENIAMPLLAGGTPRGEALRRATRWLHEVGLEGRAQHRSGELSGGEQQRVSLARALVTEPRLLLADEPTGDLDSRTAETIFALLLRLHATHGLTSVMVTHHLGLAGRCARALVLQDGRLEPLGGTPDHK